MLRFGKNGTRGTLNGNFALGVGSKKVQNVQKNIINTNTRDGINTVVVECIRISAKTKLDKVDVKVKTFAT